MIKIWLEVGMKEQERRFKARITDPLRQWKLSPMDLESFARWYDYSKARDLMLEATDSEHAPWHILRSDDKKRARRLRTRDLLTYPVRNYPLQEEIQTAQGAAPETLTASQV